MSGCPDNLEKVNSFYSIDAPHLLTTLQMFLAIEEASERRAREEEEQERVTALYTPVSRSNTPTTTSHRKDRRRGSISISRFGQVGRALLYRYFKY